MTRATARLAAVLLAVSCALPGAAAAQTGRLEAERATIFAQMLASPADRALMRDYARLSVRLRDFEAAAATLERFLDLEPGNAAARLELAAAYFALGAHEVAEYHLAAATVSGGLTPEQLDEAARYQAEAEARQDPNRIAGHIAIGTTGTRQTDETALFVSGQLDWRIDMGGPNAAEWLTQLSFSRFDPENPGVTDRQSTRLRSGPEFRLTGDAYGPRLQPYLELGWTEENDGFVLRQDSTVALGLAYQNPHNAFWTSYADIRIGRGERDVDFGFLVADTVEFDFREANLGLAFRPSRDTRIRGTVGWRDENTEDGSGTYETATTLRLEALHSFDTGWQALPRNWEARGWVQRENRETGDIFGANDATDTGYGLGLRAFVTDAIFVEARSARLRSEDALGGFARPPETIHSFQLGWEF